MALALLEPERPASYLHVEDPAMGKTGQDLSRQWSDYLETSLAPSVLMLKKYLVWRELKALENLQVGWDSYNAPSPNALATRNALRILSLVEASDLLTVRVMPSAEGGVALCFVREDRYADLECSNDGEVFGVRYVGKQMPILLPTDASDSSIRAALTEIQDHIRG
jgi:hypothetical protein